MSIYVYKNKLMKSMVFDLLIIVILLSIIYFKNYQLINFLNTNLGRFIFIIVVAILSVRNIIYGIVALVLFFILRENFYIEGLDNTNISSSSNSSATPINGPVLVDVNEVPLDGSITVKSVQESITTETITKTTDKDMKDGMDYGKNIQDYQSNNQELMSKWRSSNCSKDNLPVFNNKIVTADNLRSVFPNVSFINEKCNPCDLACNFLVSSSSDNISPSSILKPISSNTIPTSMTRFGNAMQSVNFSQADGTKAGSGFNVSPFPTPVDDSPSNLVNKTSPYANKISPAMAPSMQSIASMPK